jgi:hypothetical protein
LPAHPYWVSRKTNNIHACIYSSQRDTLINSIKDVLFVFLSGIYQKSFREGNMKVLERMVQKIGDWQALEELDKKYDAVESKYGIPAKRRYRAMVGMQTVDTLTIEREWESMAAFEVAMSRLMVDPEWNALNEAGSGVVLSTQMELYFVL